MKREWILPGILYTSMVFIAPTVARATDVFIKSGFKNESVDIVHYLMDISTYMDFYNVTVDKGLLMPFRIILAAIIFFNIVGTVGYLKKDKTFSISDDYGSDGTSRWQDKKEIHENYYKDKLGWFIGSYEESNHKVEKDNDEPGTEDQLIYKLGMNAAYQSVNSKLNMQTIVVGPPGSNKSTGFVFPNLFHIPKIYKDLNQVMPDLIVTDPKGEIYENTAEHYRNLGYDVHVLDFINLKYGDSINPLDFIYDDKLLIEIGEGYVKAVGGSQGSQGKSGNDSFWDDSESQLLSALIGYVLQTKDVSDPTRCFTEVSNVLTSEDIRDPFKALTFFKKAGVTGAPAKLYNNFLLAEDRVRANILIGLATKLRLFAIDGIQNITGSTTIDISKIGAKKEKPMILYIFMPASDRTFSPIINVILSIIFKQLYKTAAQYNSKLYAATYFIIEEMANIGKLPGIQEMLGTMRGLRIYPMMIWQSLAQMKDRYGEAGYEDIMSQCDTHIYLGANDEFTAKKIEEEVGKTTIRTQGITRSKEGIYSVDKSSESQNYKQRPLLMSDEAKRLDSKYMVVTQGHMYPVILNKVQYKYWKKMQPKVCDVCSIFDLPLMNIYANKGSIDNEDFGKTRNEFSERDFNDEYHQGEDVLFTSENFGDFSSDFNDEYGR